MLDDVAIELPGESSSADARMAAIVHAYELDDEHRTVSVQNPSAEGFAYARADLGKDASDVREQRAVYRVA